MKNFKKNFGSALLLSLFLIFFAFTIFSISFIYLKSSKQDFQESDIYYLSTMYEVYLTQLIYTVNKKIYDRVNYENLLFTINFFPLNYKLYNYQKNLNEEIPGLTTITQTGEGEIKEINITNADENQKTIIELKGVNQIRKPVLLRTIEVNLSNFYLYRNDFLNFFSNQAASNDYLKEISYNYVKNLIETTLQSFINNFKDKENINFKFTSKKEDYEVIKENDYFIINAPFKITYSFKSKNEESKISKDYFLTIKFK
ncbi:MAG: hypothetical protein ACK4GJ_03310, partial [bacterium]